MTRCQHCGAENADGARFCGACGRAVSATEPSSAGGMRAHGAAPDLVGREIGGRFRILAKLGEGGMGAVYRGEQMSLKRRVAIKLLHPELSADPSLVRRFNAEAELVAKLSHPNTVNIYDFGQDSDGTLFIAMEFLEGRSLRQVVGTEGPLPPLRALHIAGQIAGSIADAHHHGIVHRDLKPDNVMLIERGREKDVVRVLDFGIAKLRDEQKQTVNPMTRAGDLVGTPQYMAPEQIRGESVDGRADVYALGAILYETVTGRLVFDGPSLMAILSRHLLDVPEPPSRRRPDLGIPPAFDDLVADMLRKDPRERLASMELAGERIAHLASALGGYATPVPTPSPGPSPHPLPTPGRAMRPPGVPQTYPPGMMYATPSPPAPAPSLPPSPVPFQPPPQARPAPAAKKSSNTIWIVLAIVGAITAVLAIIGIANQGKGKDKKDDRVAPVPPEQPGVVVTRGDTPPAPQGGLGGDEVRLGAYRIVLPLGFIVEPGAVDELTDLPAGSDAQIYTGTIEGNLVRLIAIATGEDLSYVAKGDLDAGCRELAQNYFGGGSLEDSRAVTGQGFQRYRCTVTGPAMSAEGAFYSGPTGSLILFFATDPPTFGQLRGARDELFDRRVRAP